MTTRRAFLAGTAAALGSAAATACGGDGTPTSQGGTTTIRAPLPAVGVTVNVAGGANNLGIALTRLSTTGVVAVSRRCTHEGCRVDLPPSSLANMTCQCHGAVFTVSGSVVNGPAVAPLYSYPTSIDTATNEAVITVS